MHARAAYARYAEKDLAPRDDDEDVAASSGSATTEVDPNLFEPVEPAFATINRIEPPQRAFFSRAETQVTSNRAKSKIERTVSSALWTLVRSGYHISVITYQFSTARVRK